LKYGDNRFLGEIYLNTRHIFPAVTVVPERNFIEERIILKWG
jgi:hypothetical protein